MLLKNPYGGSDVQWGVTVHYTTVNLLGLNKEAITLTPDEAEVLGRQLRRAGREAQKRQDNYSKGQKKRFNGGR